MESDEFGESGEFGENLPKALTKTSEKNKGVSNPQHLPTIKKMSLERRHVLHVHK